MKIIDVNIIPSYSCNVCHKTFRSKKELDLNYLVICSKKCEFRFIFKLIKNMGYSERDFEIVLKNIGIKVEKGLNFKNNAIYEITKYYNKIGLPNIKLMVQGFSSNNNGSKIVHKGSRVQANPPYVIGGLNPEPEPLELNQIMEEFNND